MTRTRSSLLDNVRFYILAASVLASLAILAWLRLQTSDSQLWLIRTEQLYGYIAIGYWYVALVLSPLSKVTGMRGPIPLFLFSRRAIGVSAAYFALLHTGISFWGQVGGPAGISLLPSRFDWALGMGVVMLVILLLMAATSFDRVIRFMTFRRWKMLHRLTYIGGVLAIFHVWLIGTHIAYPWVQQIAYAALVVLFGLEAWRLTKELAGRSVEFRARDMFWTVFITTWFILAVLLLMLPVAVNQYHSNHVHPANGSAGSENEGHVHE